MKRLLPILIGLMLSLSSEAQLLYRISGNSAERPSYLLATNRYIDISYLDSIPGLFRAFGRCDKVVTEFVIEDYEAIAAMRTMTIKPAYTYSVVRDSIMSHRLGYDAGRSMDAFFPLVAADKGMKVVGLDNVGETLWMLFERHDEEYQLQQLTRLLDFPEDDVDLEREIMRLYRRGQLWDISYAVSGPNNKASFGYADYEIYSRRNLNWVKRLKPLLHDGGCFITVDAMLLGGESGLIEQLRKAGYKVKAVKR